MISKNNLSCLSRRLVNSNVIFERNRKATAAMIITACCSGFVMKPAAAACAISPNDRYEFIESISLNGSNLSNNVTLQNGDVLALTPGYSGYAYREDWSIWLDINDDSDFSDNGELIFSTSSASNSTVMAPLSIPTNVNASNAEMRIVLHADDINSDSCNFSGYGDSQDYTVTIGNGDDSSGGDGGSSEDYTLSEKPRGGTNEHILAIEINNDKYTTGNNSGYADLSDEKSFTVSDGDLITLTPTSSWGTDWAVWIDSDNNYSFDSDEKVFSGSGRRDDAVQGVLDLKGLTEGSARMRIAMNGDGNADANGFKYGEIEDYTANVQSSGGNTDPGTDPDETPDTGDNNYGSHIKWTHNTVHLKVYRFEFNDASLGYAKSRIESEMAEIADYFEKESYGRFDSSYEIHNEVIRINSNKSAYEGSSWDWVDYYEAKLVDMGEDLHNMNDDTIYLIIAPQMSNWSPKAGPNPGAIRIYDDGDTRTKAGGIIHEMGHAMGLHHAEALDGGHSVFGSGNLEEEKIGYGNIFAMMGNNAWDFGGFNLYYKNFFESWGIENEVEKVTLSGTYRIYALDQGSIGGNLGLRIDSGTGEHTYWVEYRTKDGADTDSVLLNIEGYIPDHDTRADYYGTSYLLDMTPNSILEWEGDDWNGYDLLDGGLSIGKSYTDEWNGFTITTKRTGGTLGTASAWIEVEVEMH